MELLLTDDEVVALAVAASTHWPTGLPTVAVDEEAALLASALRGRRSLAVRDLVGSDTQPNGLLEAVSRDVLGAESFVSVYIANPDLTRSDDSVNINSYRSGRDWLVETVSDIGVHQFAVCSTEELRALLLGLAEAAYERGLADGQPPASSLSIGEVSSDLLAGIAVQKLTAKRSRVTGDSVELSDLDLSDIGDEIDRLLGRAPV